ncbi:MAG: choice-of-anchor D domain-containing protein [Microscillaceae bacterium]|nr:choice-of-anchor D domain-containing protein [Microscillaceae bacterium]
MVPQLSLSAEELIFEALANQNSFTRTITLTNTGTAPLTLQSANVTGTGFSISEIPTLPLDLAPAASAEIKITFAPTTAAAGGTVFNGVLNLNSNAASNPNPQVNLYGLSVNALGGNGEPYLQRILNTIGHNINTTINCLNNCNVSTNLLGEEVLVQSFQKAGSGPVALIPVGRYSPSEIARIGWYVNNNGIPTENQLYEMPTGVAQGQTLFPIFTPSTTTFDPGSANFGIYLYASTFNFTSYTEDALNGTGPGSLVRRARVFPLKDRQGNLVPDSYIMGFEEASNGDYNDYIFIVSNVEPATVNANCADITYLDCEKVVVDFPYELDFNEPKGGINDFNGIGTGFTMIQTHSAPRLAQDPAQPDTTDIIGYAPQRLNVVNGNLEILASKGIAFLNNNAQLNTLGAGLDAEGRKILMETRLINPTTGGGAAQTGLWYGLNEDNFVKLVVVGTSIEFRLEQNGLSPNVNANVLSVANLPVTSNPVTLRMMVDNSGTTDKVSAFYQIGSGSLTLIGEFNHNFGAGTNVYGTTGTSYAGVFATYRNGAAFTARIDKFLVDEFVENLTFSTSNVSETLLTNQSSTFSLDIAASDGLTPLVNLTADANGSVPNWLTVNGNPLDGTLTHNTAVPEIVFGLNSTGLAEGTYVATVRANSPGYEAAEFIVTLTVISQFRPYVEAVHDGELNIINNGSTGVGTDISISTTNINFPNAGSLANATVNSSTVLLYKLPEEALVPSIVNSTAGGDAITLTPTSPLLPNTSYRFEITEAVEDVTGAAMVPFEVSFTTGTGTSGGGSLAGINFSRIDLGAAALGKYTTLVIGPDEKLYAAMIDGRIKRFPINADGTLGTPDEFSPFGATPKILIGLEFAPEATAGNLVAWISYCDTFSENFQAAPNWDGNVARIRLSATVNTVEENTLVIDNLPRSTRDHLTNSVRFGPEGALYIMQSGNNAMGKADAAWGNREETLLSAAVLRLDVSNLPANLPINALTPEGGGSYNPFAPGAPLTIYATGIRNGYDLLWHSNGALYVPANGSAAGGTTPTSNPASPNYLAPHPHYTYTGPTNIPSVSNVQPTQNDWLFRVQPGGYYGHPNPYRAEYVLNRGDIDVNDPAYNGIQPDPNYRGAAFDFGLNKSPNGVIEYQSSSFNGVLRGMVMVVRYSNQDDVIMLLPGGLNKDIVADYDGSDYGLGGLFNPIDLIEDTRNGNLYIAEFGSGETESDGHITLFRPAVPPVSNGKITLSTSEIRDNTVSGQTGLPRNLSISNTGTGDLQITGFSIIGANNTEFVLLNTPTLPLTLAPGADTQIQVRFNPISTGLKLASLRIASNDAATPSANVNLRGLGTAGLGGANEPSLQQVLNLYGYGVNVGDDNPNTNTLHSTQTNGVLLGDEIAAQRFEKVVAGPVTFEVLAVFGPTASNPIVRMGWYNSGNANSVQELLTVSNSPASNGQTVNVPIQGSSSFEIGFNQPFGFYSEWPFFSNRRIFSEDALNTFSGAIPHHVRVYAMKNALGEIIPNEYLIAFEEHITGFDYQDIVLRARNLQPYTEPALESIVFQPAQRNVILEAQTSDQVWTTIGLSGATTASLTLTAIDNATGTTPTWLNPSAFAWGQAYNYQSTTSALAFTANANGLSLGNYTATVTANATGFSAGTFVVNLEVSPAMNWTYRVNFQTSVTATPAGFLPDNGLGFQVQNINGTNYEFGWVDPATGNPKSNAANARLRTDTQPIELRSLNHMQLNAASNWANWKMSLPNGNYYVKIASGDVAPNINSEHRINVEASEGLYYPVSSVGTAGFATQISNVLISDGTLDVTATGTNTKISYIWIGQPQAPALNLLFNPVTLETVQDFGSGVETLAASIGTSTGFANTITLEVISGNNWLSAPATVGMGTFNLTTNVSGLVPGIYQGQVRATAPGYQAAILTVNLEVIPVLLSFSQTELRFGIVQNGTATNQTLSLSASVGNPTITLSKSASDGWLVMPANPSLGTLSFGINAGALAPGLYEATVRASGQGCVPAELLVRLLVSADPGGNAWTYKINFQHNLTSNPGAEWTRDQGDPYGTLTVNGNAFGWINPADGTPYDNKAQSRLRGGAASSLPLVDRTFNHMQFSATEQANWEIALPNDTYEVYLSVGDPLFTDSHHIVEVEGKEIVSYDQEFWYSNDGTQPYQNLKVIGTVTLTDGKLTLNGQKGSNTKIQYVWIRPFEPINDDIAPSVSVILDGNEIAPNVYKNEVVVRATASDQGGSGLSTFEFSLNQGTTWQSYTNSLLFDEPGNYNLVFRATDGNGNQSITPNYAFEVEFVPLNNTKMVLENRDKFPENDELTFHRIQNGWFNNGVQAEFHDFVTLRVHNRGLQTLQIFDLVLSNPDYWAIETLNGNPYTTLSVPFSINSNNFVDIGLRFIAIEPPNPRSNGIKVLHETLTIISNDDESPNKAVKLHGLWQRDGEGTREPMASEILDAFGLTIDIAFPQPNFKDGSDFSANGDEIYTNNFVRADDSQPIYMRQLAAYHGCCNSSDRSFTQNIDPNNNGGRIGNKGTQRTIHIGPDGQTLLPRRDKTGPVGTLGDPAEAEFTLTGPFNITLNNDCTNPGLNYPNTFVGDPDPDLVGVRIWKLRNSKGEIVPFTFVMANDVLFANSNFDYNDNLFLVRNVRPEFGTGYASLLASGNGIVGDPDEKQSTINFGEQATGSNTSRTLHLRSLGQVYPGDDDPNIRIDFVEVVGQNRGDFYAEAPLDNDLAPQEATTVQVHFAPSEFGVKQAVLLIHYNSDQSPMRIPLFGIAADGCYEAELVRRIKTALPATDTNDDEDNDPLTFTLAGKVWETDVPYRQAGFDYQLDAYDFTSEIKQTDEDALYRRYMSSNGDGKEIGYQIPLSNGEYTVRLHFAEIFGPFDEINSRVNDIFLEGTAVAQGLDIYDEVGHRTALVKDFEVTVNDGNLNILIDPIINRPAIAGIEIFRFNYQSTLALQLVQNTSADCGAANGSIEVNATGATGNVQYKLGKFGPYQTSGLFAGLEPNLYTLYALDEAGCETFAEYTLIANPSAITFDLNLTNARCDVANSGSVTIANITGGAAPYSIEWNGNPLQTGTDFTGLLAGNYFVTVTDANGCENIENFTIDSDLCLVTLRINAGGNAYTTADGRLFIADAYANGNIFANNSLQIANTEDDPLYRTQRFRNGNLNYNIPVVPGEYRIILHFAEIYDQITAPGQRLFDIRIENNPVAEDVDVFAEAGGLNIAIQREFIFTLNDNNLDLDFIKGTENPFVSAIEVVPFVPASNQPPIVNLVIPAQTAEQGVFYTYTVPSFAFLDAEDSNNLILSATLGNGSPLPAWLTFNPATRQFSGTPTGADTGLFSIILTATDTEGAFVTQTFTLEVRAQINLALTQNVRPLIAGANDKAILRIEIEGAAGLRINAFTFNTTGTTNSGDISAAQVFSTGNLPVFRKVQAVGSQVNAPNGQFVFNGLNEVLADGPNYFWLTYDLAEGVEEGHFLDAALVSITVEGNLFSPVDGNPVGARIVRTTDRVPGQQINFDGNTGYLVLDNQDEGYFDFETSFSIEAWIKVNAFDKENQAIITKGNNAWRLQRAGLSNVAMFVVEGAGAVTGTTALNDNEWHHLVVVYDEVNLRLFVDGKLDNEEPAVGTPVLNNSPVWIGANAEVMGLYFNGQIDEVAFWRKALTQAEIREKRHLTLDGNENGLLAYFQLNEPAGGLLQDWVEGFTANLNGGTSRQPATAPVGGGLCFSNSSLANGTVEFLGTGLSLQFGANHPEGELVVTRIIGLSPAGNEAAPGDNKFADYWIVNNYGEEANLSPMRLIFNLPGGFLLSGNAADYQMNKRASNATGTWTETFGANNVNLIDETLSFAGITGFSQIVLSGSGIGLPVRLASFDGRRLNENQVELFWSTASEEDNLGFEVQKSESGLDFESIGFVEGAGNSVTLRNYQFVDTNASQGAYYRLKQLDQEGDFAYSNVVFITGEAAEKLEIYPNPIDANQKLEIRASGTLAAQEMRLVVTDLRGKVILEAQGSLLSLRTALNQNIAQWANGAYILRFVSPLKAYTFKLIRR